MASGWPAGGRRRGRGGGGGGGRGGAGGRRERDRSVTGGWRYQVTWVPVRDQERVVLSGSWLVVVPAGVAGGDLAAGCVRALAAHGAEAVVIETAADAGRQVLADRIGQVLAGTEDPRLSGV